MSRDLSNLWVEKYRPQTLKNYIFQNETHKKTFETMISEGSIPHLLFSGTSGVGKTCLSQILVNELNVNEFDVLRINASDENSVDVMREKIKGFITTYAMGDFKIVQLEEADYITSNGQAVLRQMMEEYADFSRFILTCNYENKIIPAIRSRCQVFRFKVFDKDDIAELVANILLHENVTFNLDVLDKYIAVGYPDIRKIINMVQQNSISSELLAPKEIETGDYKFKILDLIGEGDWDGCRELICSSASADEWEGIYRFLYENLSKAKGFSSVRHWEDGIIIIAEHLYRDGIVADREINFAACIIRLSQLFIGG